MAGGGYLGILPTDDMVLSGPIPVSVVALSNLCLGSFTCTDLYVGKLSIGTRWCMVLSAVLRDISFLDLCLGFL